MDNLKKCDFLIDLIQMYGATDFQMYGTTDFQIYVAQKSTYLASCEILPP